MVDHTIKSQTVALNPNQILAKELSPDMKQWEELIRENVFRLGGHQDCLSACLAHMLYCVVAKEQYNLAYFFVKRIECARATPTANLPYGMFLTCLYRCVMKTARRSVSSLSSHHQGTHLINTMMMMMMSKLLEQTSRNGKKYGFVRYKVVRDVEGLLGQLQRIRFGEEFLKVFVAFDRRTARSRGLRVNRSCHEKLNDNAHVSDSNRKGEYTGRHDDRKFVDVVEPMNGHMGRFDLRMSVQKNERCIEIYDIELNTKLMGRSVAGELKALCFLTKLLAFCEEEGLGKKRGEPFGEKAELSDDEKEDDDGEVRKGVYGDGVLDMDYGDWEHVEDEGSRCSWEIKVNEYFDEEETHGNVKKNDGGDTMGEICHESHQTESIADKENHVGNIIEATRVSNKMSQGLGPGPNEELGFNEGIGLANRLYRESNGIFQFGKTSIGEAHNIKRNITMEQVKEVGDLIGVSWIRTEEEGNKENVVRSGGGDNKRMGMMVADIGAEEWSINIIRNEHPNVIGIQETKCGMVDEIWIEDLWGGKGFGFAQLPVNAFSCPTSAGIRASRYGSSSDEEEEGEHVDLANQQRNRMPRIKADIPTFSGSLNIEDFLDWVFETEKYFVLMDITEDSQVKYVAYKLKGAASSCHSISSNNMDFDEAVHIALKVKLTIKKPGTGSSMYKTKTDTNQSSSSQSEGDAKVDHSKFTHEVDGEKKKATTTTTFTHAINKSSINPYARPVGNKCFTCKKVGRTSNQCRATKHVNLAEGDKINQDVFNVIVDGRSNENIISRDIVTRLKLTPKKHPKPYKIGWIKAVGEDLNVVRCNEDMLNPQINCKEVKDFNEFINDMRLVEIPMGGRRFTRISNDGLKFSKLDRFLMNEEFINLWCNLVVVFLDQEFRIERGVRQGDPFSPFLFILAVEGLNAIMNEAVANGIFKGVKVGVSELELSEMASWMGCSVGEFPFTYLGLPIGKDMKKDSVTASYGVGGLNIGSLRAKNLALIGKWRWRFRKEYWGYGLGYERKEGSVTDMEEWVNDQWRWEWDWVRNIRGRVCREYDDLVEVMQNVVITNTCRDRWRWKLSEDRDFKVKELSRLVEDKILLGENYAQETLWNKLVPKKVNVFVWRAIKDVNVPASLASAWQAVIWTSGYFIWKERNARVFGKKCFKY
nr:transposon TX1 [Tanacetum cinerariifolium]